jgi:ubiquinone/menaquinone biosynthesis C-methylase UbiE
MTSAKWPKILPPLSSEQQRISDDFMQRWHEVLPRRFGLVESFNHGYSVQHAPPTFLRTLEIGAGAGEHFRHERLSDEQRAHYYALELRENMCCTIRKRFPSVQVIRADCQERLPFEDNFFDRVLAIHVLEHLPCLPAAIREAHRVCRKDGGVFSVMIPCEGGAAYGLARRISAQRIFEKQYKQSYKWFIEREHINRPAEIMAELDPYFRVVHRHFFPLVAPVTWCNLIIGLTLVPKG